MWKIIIPIVLLIPTFSFALTPAENQLQHLAALKLKHPNGIIGDEFGILNDEDMTINECEITPEPYVHNKGPIMYSYWQCFKTADVSFECTLNSVPDEHEGVVARVALNVTTPDTLHRFIGRRPWKLKWCEEYLENFKKLTKKTDHICISGSPINEEVDGKGKKMLSWLFDKYKTNKGCESYFDGLCSLKYVLKNHGCEILGIPKKH